MRVTQFDGDYCFMLVAVVPMSTNAPRVMLRQLKAVTTTAAPKTNHVNGPNAYNKVCTLRLFYSMISSNRRDEAPTSRCCHGTKQDRGNSY